MRPGAGLYACLKYAYIRLPIPEWHRYRLKSAWLWLLSPWLGRSASWLFWAEQRRLSRAVPERSPDGVDTGGAACRETGGPRLLLIDSCTPTPDRDSGSLDVFNSIRIFRELGFRVTFIPESNLLHLGAYTRALEDLGVECPHAPGVTSVRAWLRAHGREYAVVMLFRAPVAIRHLDSVRRHCPAARVVFSTIDLHLLREARGFGADASQPPALNRLWRAELDCMRRADRTIVISEVERDWLEAVVPGLRPARVPLVREWPAPGPLGFAQRSGLVFVGNFQHPPNRDAVCFFLDDIWPEVRRSLPDAVFHIVGSYLPDAIRERAGPGVEPLGYLETLDDLFGRVRVAVAPLRFGAGLKGKVATSLGYGLPSVITGIAAEGMGLENGRDVLIADDPVDFAAAVVRLHRDPLLWERLSRQGRETARELFSLDVSRRAYADLFSELGCLPVATPAPRACGP